MPTVRIAATVPAAFIDELDVKALALGQPRSYLIREAIRQYLDPGHGRKIVENFLRSNSTAGWKNEADFKAQLDAHFGSKSNGN